MNLSRKYALVPFPIMLVFLSLVLASLACQVDLGGPQAPGASIPVQPAAAEELQANWQSALEAAVETGQVSILINEAQMTAFLAERIETREEPLIRNPQVYLQNDQIHVYGIAERGILKANILITVTPELSQEGEITFQLSEASVGPVPAPSALKSTISAVLTEAFTGSIGSLATGIRISSLAITDGLMTIVGELR
ncbi:MAG: hypothetical protein P1P76_03405 [Anaerolineales bacterium]|nr:hypothetical protein [Anaerolineales bacterium]